MKHFFSRILHFIFSLMLFFGPNGHVLIDTCKKSLSPTGLPVLCSYSLSYGENEIHLSQTHTLKVLLIHDHVEKKKKNK